MHLLCSRQRILDRLARRCGRSWTIFVSCFVERIGEVGKSPFQATGILLQLLLGTLDHAIRGFGRPVGSSASAGWTIGTTGADYARLASQRQEHQAAWGSVSDRYGSAVRSAMVGVEAVPGMDPRGAEELNDYADQVDDFQEQLQERRRWMSDILHDAANAIAQRQGEQINRLTLVSLIFLPITAVTGFFGMNFGWMTAALRSEAAFLTLGVLLPALMVLLTVAWFIRRGFIQIGRRPPAHASRDDAQKSQANGPAGDLSGGQSDPPSERGRSRASYPFRHQRRPEPATLVGEAREPRPQLLPQLHA